MKKIELTQNKVALVDDDDFVRLNAFKWCFGNGYAMRSIRKPDGKKGWYMHWDILGRPSKGLGIDHKDMNRLNNQKNNLRISTTSQNQMNRGKQKNNTAGFKGVSWHKGGKKWRTRISLDGKNMDLGYFSTAEEAYKVYCEACVKYHGEFSNIG